PTMSVAKIPRNGSVTATITAAISGSSKVTVAGTIGFSGGLEDSAGLYLGGRVGLHDDGMRGDATAGDGTFTGTGFSAESAATVGPRIIRIKAEVKSADGRRHATATDFSGMEVN